jgi:proprotein convertase subtilisin/kexin type 2
MQHLTVLTAKRNQLYDPTNKHLWHINGAGLEFNHLFGFGVLDAGEMVRTAQNWKPLPPRSHCEAGSIKKKQYGD